MKIRALANTGIELSCVGLGEMPLSLSTLPTDCITWYQLHATDPKVHFIESVGALARLQDEGKIQHMGLSNVGVQRFRRPWKLLMW